jgi:hypothetical protein
MSKNPNLLVVFADAQAARHVRRKNMDKATDLSTIAKDPFLSNFKGGCV